MNIDPKIRRRLTETASYYPRDIQHRVYMQHWLTVVISPVEDLVTLRKLGFLLTGTSLQAVRPGVDMSSVHLDRGISVACGMALGAKMSGCSFRVYTPLGDGEIEEARCGKRNVSPVTESLINPVLS